MRRPLLVLCSCLALVACDPKGPKPKPKPQEPGASQAEAGVQAEAGEPESETGAAEAGAAETETGANSAAPADGPELLSADPEHSKVGFFVERATTGHVAEFERFEAKLELADEVPQRLEIAVKLGSVVADRSGLTQHLKSSDFFDVDKFPTATFTTESITPQAPTEAETEGETEDEPEPNRYTLKGTMRLHGVSKPLEFPATIEVSPEQVRGTAKLKISAKAFGIDYEGMEAELAEDQVSLEIELAFPRVAGP